MKHLFRVADDTDGRPFPQWRTWRNLLLVAARVALARLRGLFSSLRFRQLATVGLLLLGLVVQGVLILTAAYLLDLALSLMELWAELARKHLELVLS